MALDDGTAFARTPVMPPARRVGHIKNQIEWVEPTSVYEKCLRTKYNIILLLIMQLGIPTGKNGLFMAPSV